MEAWLAITSIVIPTITFAGFVLSVFWNAQKHRETREAAERKAMEAAVAEAEERGKMEERQAVMERQLDAAHNKLRAISQKHEELDNRVVELRADVKHILKSVDVLVDIHTTRD